MAMRGPEVVVPDRALVLAHRRRARRQLVKFSESQVRIEGPVPGYAAECCQGHRWRPFGCSPCTDRVRQRSPSTTSSYLWVAREVPDASGAIRDFDAGEADCRVAAGEYHCCLREVVFLHGLVEWSDPDVGEHPVGRFFN
jgi:hypothetical protein